MSSPADKFMPSKSSDLGCGELFSLGYRLPAVAVLFRLVHIAQQLRKCEEVIIMLMCLMFVDPPHLIHLDGA